MIYRRYLIVFSDIIWYPDSQVAMESKDSMFEVHVHEDESGEIDLGRGAASGDDRMVSPMAAIDHMYVNKNQPIKWQT